MRRAAVIFAAGAVLAGPPAIAQPPPERGAARSLQDDASWRVDPHLREFYDAVTAACAQGCARADVPALEAKARIIFADMARARRMNVGALQQHLAGIPRQVIGIAKDDSAVIKDYDAFILALFGPE